MLPDRLAGNAHAFDPSPFVPLFAAVAAGIIAIVLVQIFVPAKK